MLPIALRRPAAGLFAVALLLFATAGCASPQRDSFTAKPKADPSEHVAPDTVNGLHAAPPRTEKFTARPKAKPRDDHRQGPYAPAAPFAAPPLVGDLEVHFIKVGQGDSTLLKFPNGNTLLVDGGSLKDRDPEALKDYLAAEITDGTLATPVITHPDADHYNCLPYAVAGLTVGQVLMVGTSSAYDASTNVASASSMTAIGFKTWIEAVPAAKRKRLQTSDIDDQGDPSNSLFKSGDVNISPQPPDRRRVEPLA